MTRPADSETVRGSAPSGTRTAEPQPDRDVVYRLQRWAIARDRRNPDGHGKSGTALLREAARTIEALRGEQELLVGSRDHWRALAYRGFDTGDSVASETDAS